MKLLQIAHVLGVSETRQVGCMPVYYTHVMLGKTRIRVESHKKDKVWDATIAWKAKGYNWSKDQQAWVKE